MPPRTNYIHDEESNTYFVFYQTNSPLMFDNKTEVIDVAYARKYLEAMSEDAKVIVLSVPQMTRMSRKAALDMLREKGFEPRVSDEQEAIDEAVSEAGDEESADQGESEKKEWKSRAFKIYLFSA